LLLKQSSNTKDSIKRSKQMATSDFLLKIEQVKGESQQEGKKEYIDIESWSWGAQNSGSMAQGGGGGTGKVSCNDFHFVCKNGTSAMQVFGHCATGTHIQKATLECRKAGGDSKTYTYYKVDFEKIVISSYQEGGSGGSDLLPMAQISFNYQKVQVEYSEQNPTNGQVVSKGIASYDQSKGVGTKA
jgi:type VI secretion system secreted protein Hcp